MKGVEGVVDVVMNDDDVVGVILTEQHGDGFRQGMIAEVLSSMCANVEGFGVRNEDQAAVGPG